MISCKKDVETELLKTKEEKIEQIIHAQNKMCCCAWQDPHVILPIDKHLGEGGGGGGWLPLLEIQKMWALGFHYFNMVTLTRAPSSGC